MITYVRKDLFESPAQVLVNTVNTVGVMGKGIAKRFKQTYPTMFEQYQIYCEQNKLDVGMLWLYKTPHKWVLNFPTKKHWRSPSKLEYIEAGLQKFVATYEEKGISSISFPLLGCGNGGLNWEQQVKPLMEKYLRPLPIEVFIHLTENNIKPEHKSVEETKKWLQSMPLFLSFNEVWEDLLFEISKLDFELFHEKRKWEVKVIDYMHLSSEGINISEEEANSEMIVFTNRDSQVTISKIQLTTLWSLLRNVGFCMKQDLPDGLDEVGGLIFSLLNKLDYIEPVDLGRRYDNEDDLTTGIRVIPYKAYNKQDFKGEILNEVEKG